MDPTWQWCERVKKNNCLKLKCSFCENTFSGGISRMKHHLAGTSKDVSQCVGGPNKPLPPFVRQQCLDMLHALRQKRIQKEIEEADVGYNEPLEDEEEEEEAYECDDEDDSSLRIDLEASRGRDRRRKGIMYERGRSGITGRKRRGTTDITAWRVVFGTWDNLPPFELGQPCVQVYVTWIRIKHLPVCRRLPPDATGCRRRSPEVVARHCRTVLPRKSSRELQKTLARKHTSQFDPISLENFDDLEPWIEEEPATIFDDEDLECFNLEVEATKDFVDEGEFSTVGVEYVGEDLLILDDEDEEEDENEDEDDEDYE
ncbi:hypothetical protein EJ110_NYTH39698 [Nymphaea thermarum]|nr:hypothetical protein EJ110_NYTH39698 [Nymphaea thermarum]